MTSDGRTYEAIGIDGRLIHTRHFNGERGPTLDCGTVAVLERTYEEGA